MFQSSVQELADWMNKSTDDDEMTSAMSSYLMAQGEMTLEEAAERNITGWHSNVNNQCKHLIDETDRLGWDCLVEGRVSSRWIEYAKDKLNKNRNPMSPES